MNVDIVVKEAYNLKMTGKNPLDCKGVKDFINAWENLSQRGFCDSCYGMEFERVLLTWMLSGHPSDIKQFIKKEANRLID